MPRRTSGRTVPGRARRKNLSSTAGMQVPVVGIGASAGGLDAFIPLLRNLPLDTGMGFVLIQHLDPLHESSLTQLLARATAMNVQEIRNGMRLEPNRVYIIPPNRTLTISDGLLKLQPRSHKNRPHHSIDIFFESLAQEQHERSIGVILSGTASDGTIGLEAIKSEGGITFAQDDSARYDSMPRSAVAAGVVDFVLSPEEIARELARIAKHPYVRGEAHELLASAEKDRAWATAHEEDETTLPAGDVAAIQARSETAGGGRDKAKDSAFKKILLLLRNHSGVDFSLYKSTTIRRRIMRRMVLNQKNNPEEYADFLRGNAEELDALYSDALINVTSFFRNPHAFDILKRKVFPKLLQQQTDEPVRVWVLGCSTGQEAYSIAMSFMEAARKTTHTRKLQVFATDLNEALLDKARHGLYTRSLAQNIEPERLRDFFVEEAGGYRIIKQLREMIVFARQNLISDPPFSRMDLITCRNLLIYLEPDLQRKVIPIFHHALKPGGFLFLGASESIGPFTGLFEPLDKKQRIYSKKASATPPFQLPARKPSTATPHAVVRSTAGFGQMQPEHAVEGFHAERNAHREADRLLLGKFAPPGVLIDKDFQILQFRGETGRYLKPPAGKATFDLLKMAKEGLMLPLRSAVTRARKGNKTVRVEGLAFQQDGKTHRLNVEVVPLKNTMEPCFLILFDEGQQQQAHQASEIASRARRPVGQEQEAQRLDELETELSEMRDYLQSIQEQYEATNEELQASNEEVQSANEELQSLNEELETSKEELESANEELTTVNEEMSNRNIELLRLNSDLVNLETSTKLAIVQVSRDLTIRHFSAPAEKLFKLAADDIGRAINKVGLNLVFQEDDLENLVAEVIDTMREKEFEVQAQEGVWYSLRVRPYITLDNKVDGAVVVLVNIDELKRSHQDVLEARDYAESIIRSVRDPLLILNRDLRIHSANEAFYKTFKISASEVQGRLIYDLRNGEWNIPALRKLLEEVLPQNSCFDNFEVTHEFEDLGMRSMLLNGRRLESGGDQPGRILLGIEDITYQIQNQERTRLSLDRYSALVNASAQIVWTSDATGAMVEDSPSWRAFTGQTYEDCRGFGWLRAIHPADQELVGQLWRNAVADHTPIETEYRIRHISGDWRWTDMRAVPVFSPDGSVREWIGMNLDISERKQAAQTIALLGAIVEGSEDAIISKDLNGTITSWNEAATRILGYTREEAIGQSVTMLIPKDRLNEEDAILERIRRGESVQHFETIRITREGKPLAMSLTISPIRDSQGAVIGASSVGRDITQQKRVEQVLQESETRFRQVANAMPQIVWAARPDGVVEYYNDRWYEYTGFSRDDFGESGWKPILHPDDVQRAVDSYFACVREGRAFNIEYRFKDRFSGGYRWFMGQALPLRNEQGEIVRWIGSCTDIDSLKQAQESLQVNQRQLQDAVAKVEEASRAKDLFLATVSHELRTPLNAILGWAYMLRSKSLEPAALDLAVDAIYQSARNQAQIIDDLLDVARIISGKIAFEPSTVNVVDIMSKALTTVHHAINAKNIQLKIHYSEDADSLSLLADRQRLQQVFWNLLSNAVKFTPNGGTIEIQVSRSGSDVVIIVRDTGKGIKRDFLPLVFERFRQADSSTTRKFGGLGLGLSISKDLVEMHGGTISVTSEGEDKGSTFTMHLPITHEPDAIPPTRSFITETRLGEQADDPIEMSGKRILLVDDDENTLHLLRKAFEQSGADLRSGSSAREGLEILGSWLPDLLISDLAMADHDGYWLIENVRSLPSPAGGIPAIALSAYAAATDRTKALSAGFQVFVAKPVEPAQMLATAKALLDRKPSKQNITSEFSPNPLSGKKILLVEDDAMSNEVLRVTLEGEGAEVRSAERVSEALAILQQWAPDMIVSDLGLPGEDGYSFIRKIRALPSRKFESIPAVALTGYGPDEGARAIAAGFQHYKGKPIDPSAFVAFLKTVRKR